jgi:hypothetical protein
VRASSRILEFDRDGKAVTATFPIATAESGVDCIVSNPTPPMVTADGTTFLFSQIDPAIFALDASLNVIRGWPFRPTGQLERPGRDDPRYELNCSELEVPAVGPDNSLYLPLQSRSASVGGNIVRVGSDGRPTPGWPVELQRRGAAVWKLVVGSDGTAYALAVEPESGSSTSATILAIGPDSTVLYRRTIIDP